MVPPRPPRHENQHRFPRPRGDGVSRTATRALLRPVPPPARGWSRLGRGEPGHADGSPARAGMVPRRETSGALRRRFPRPRGDGPHGGANRQVIETVPPPARGWSTQVDRLPAVSRSSSAGAGVAPSAPKPRLVLPGADPRWHSSAFGRLRPNKHLWRRHHRRLLVRRHQLDVADARRPRPMAMVTTVGFRRPRWRSHFLGVQPDEPSLVVSGQSLQMPAWKGA